jgi:hypothetical protein
MNLIKVSDSISDKRVSDFKDEILSSKRVLLNAPLGSGKTYFAYSVLPSLGNTLFITSRGIIKRSTSNNAKSYFDAPDSDFKDYDNLTVWHQWDVKNNTYNINYYKYVVIDEIHSITADSTFTDAANHVSLLIKNLPHETTLIMTSAVADRVKDFITDVLKVPVNYIDLYGKVREVTPKSTNKITYKRAKSKLLTASNNNKMLYFCETTANAYELEKELIGNWKRAIAITSKPENRLVDKGSDKESRCFKYLSEFEKFPDDIDIIITTSKLREGLNLNGSNVKIVMTELKDWVSLKQCSGRVRNGVDEYLIITDRGNHAPGIDKSKLNSVDSYLSFINYVINPKKLNKIPLSDDNLQKFITGIKKNYDNLILCNNGRFFKNLNMLYENDLRRCEFAAIKKNMDAYLARYVTLDNKQVIFESIIKDYIGKKLSPPKASELVALLNAVNIEGKSLKPIVTKYGHKMRIPKNNTSYKIL